MFKCTPFLILFVVSVSSLDFPGDREMSIPDPYEVCPDLEKNRDWIESQSLWYTPYWNKVTFFGLAAVIYGEEPAKAIPLSHLDKACPVLQRNNKALLNTYHVFGNATLYCKGYRTPLRYGRQDHHGIINGKDTGYTLSSRWVLSKRDRYLVVIYLIPNGELGVVVQSTTPKLADEDWMVIETKLKSLGVMTAKLFHIDYEKNCPNYKAEVLRVEGLIKEQLKMM